MKTTVKALLASALGLTVLWLGTCFAETIDSVKENMDTQEITVSGSNLVADDKVLIEIFGYDDEEVDYNTELEGIVVANTDSEGSYSVTFKLPGRITSGVKKISVKPLVGKYAEDIFDFYSSSSINTILSNWNEAITNQDKSKMENVVNDETALKIILNSKLVPTLRSELLDKNKDALTRELLKLHTAEIINDFAGEFIDPYVNFAVNNLTPETAAKLILEFYDSIDTEKGGVYDNIISKMTDDEKMSVFSDVVSKKTSNITNEELVKGIYKSALFDKFKGITYYQDVKPFIDAYNTEEYFNIDFSVYNTLENTYNVDSKVLDRRSEYSDFATFKTKYEGWMREEKTNENALKNNVSNSGGGGGGGGGGGMGVIGSSGNGGGFVVEVKETVFDDLSDFEWAKEHILSLYDKGVIDGIERKVFAPSQAVTREQFVKIASALCDMPESIEDAGFEDVKKGEWYEKYINAAKQIGLVSGQSEERFGVGENIKRQDAALILYNAIKISKPEVVEELEIDQLSFKDSDDISSYAIYAVSVLNKLGVLNGDDNGYLNPAANASRAEAAVMINKVLSLID
ncbi:MAG: S-layer homology domain-containing protein [Clostridiales bacterium]|nr:S-layer homology domain-containing protein [Clostridiales bacterium]